MITKNVPKELQDIFKQAESHFPEIADIEIHFIYKDAKTATFQTRPEISSLLGGGTNLSHYPKH